MPQSVALRAAAGWLAGLLFPAVACANINSVSISSTGVTFGTFSGTQTTATGTISVTYNGSGNNNPTIALSAGGSGVFSARKMSKSGGNTLTYNLYQDSAHTIIWGDGSGGSQLLQDNVHFQGATTIGRDYSVFGRLPAQTPTASGAYLDTIVVTVTF